MSTQPRVRMFAGPNGSGKSSLIRRLHEEGRPNLHAVVNADVLLRQLMEEGAVRFSAMGLRPTRREVEKHLATFPLTANRELPPFEIKDGILAMPDAAEATSYLGAALADFSREVLLREHRSFSFETVMSHPGKVNFLRRAWARGYRTYLYYVATNDVRINQTRVRMRVARGGHDVPDDKLIARYHRSLGLLPEAIRSSSRAYLFDNSDMDPEGRGFRRVAEWHAKDNDGTFRVAQGEAPAWLKAHVLPHLSR